MLCLKSLDCSDPIRMLRVNYSENVFIGVGQELTSRSYLPNFFPNLCTFFRDFWPQMSRVGFILLFFYYHRMPLLGFEPMSVELRRLRTLRRMLYRLSYRACGYLANFFSYLVIAFQVTSVCWTCSSSASSRWTSDRPTGWK